jgi:hypothetical protein
MIYEPNPILKRVSKIIAAHVLEAISVEIAIRRCLFGLFLLCGSITTYPSKD